MSAGRTGGTISPPMKVTTRLGLCLETATLFMIAQTVWGETYLVRPDGSGDFPSISSAVQAAQSGDEILLGDGEFTGDENRNVIMEYNALSIRSESGDPSRCRIDCSGGSPLVSNRAFFWWHTGTAEPILEGVTITGGQADIGGALLIYYSSPRIRNCVLSGNSAQEGGAIMCQGDLFIPNEAAPIIEDCVIAKNVASTYPGGAIFCTYRSLMRIVRCTIAENAAIGLGPGGGIAWVKS